MGECDGNGDGQSNSTEDDLEVIIALHGQLYGCQSGNDLTGDFNNENERNPILLPYSMVHTITILQCAICLHPF